MMNMCKRLIVAVCGGLMACACAPVAPPAPPLSCKSLPANAGDQARAVQQALAGLGYQIGPQDGKMNGNTLEALRTFQADMGLPATGRTDGQTLEALGFCVSNVGNVDFPADRRGRIQTAQRLLAGQGYDPGPADGQMGKKTHDALKQFQADMGLKQTGEVDAATRDALTGFRPAKTVDASEARHVAGKQNASQKAEVRQSGDRRLTPKGMEIIEAEIRKHLTDPTTAVFSGWSAGADRDNPKNTLGMFIVTGSNIPETQWGFKLKQDGMLLLSGIKVDEIRKASAMVANGMTHDEMRKYADNHRAEVYTIRVKDPAGMIMDAPKPPKPPDPPDPRSPEEITKDNAFLTICKSGNYEQIKAAIDKGFNEGMFNTGATDKDGNNALHIAAINNYGPDIMQLLVGCRINPFDSNKKGESPLEIYEKKNGNKKSIKILKARIEAFIHACDGLDTSETACDPY